MTSKEKEVVKKYKDKIYFKHQTILGNEDYLNLRTVKAIAKEAGLVKPKPCDVWRASGELTDDSCTDNSIYINFEMYDFYGESAKEVESLFGFCQWIASLYDANGEYNPKASKAKHKAKQGAI